MNYEDGTEARCGDKVRISASQTGFIVFSIDTNEYSTDFPKGDWEYLKAGVMVRLENGALVHITSWHDLELSLIERK